MRLNKTTKNLKNQNIKVFAYFLRVIFVCNCGYPFYNTIISKVVVAIQIILNLVLDKPFISKSKNKYLLLIINIVLIAIFLIGLKLMPNDMDKLHSLMFVEP